MSKVALLREQFASAHQTWDMTLGDVTNEVAHWKPSGTAHPVGSRYVHMVVAEDALISMLKGTPPLSATTYQGKTGASDPQMFATAEWASSLKVDIPKVNEYAKAVYQQTDDYLASISEKEAEERKVDMTQYGFGMLSLPYFLSRLLIAHAYEVAGEVYAVKGLQGLKGSPY